MVKRELVVIEANIDDMNPEIYPHLFELLFKDGARDVWLVPCIMKHGRPGQVLSVLSDPATREKLTITILKETTSIGIRTYMVERHELERQFLNVETNYGQISVKISSDIAMGILQISPEFSSCKAAAAESNAPLADIYAAATAAARQEYETSKQLRK